MTAPALALDRTALAELCREYELDLVILFGSRARGQARADSDSDLGILSRGGLIPSDDMSKLYARLREITGLPEIDLIDLRRAPPLLKYNAAHDAMVLYESEPGRFNLFHVWAWKLYLDDRLDLRQLDAEYIRRSLQRFRV